MSQDHYFIFNDLLADSDLGFPQSQVWKLPLLRVSWISGARHVKHIPTPIEAHLNPEFSSVLHDAYHEFIPIWSNRLISALRQAGVDNIDTYDAVIRDPRIDLVTTDFKAVNIIGLVDCVDMNLSRYDPRSERGAREFIKMVIDPKKARGLKIFRLLERPTVVIIDQSVKEAINAAPFRGVRADSVDMTPE
jgi:hypothetical protein